MVAENLASSSRSRHGTGGGIVLALGGIGDPWGAQLARRVREDALPHGRSTLVLTDRRWYEHLLETPANAALITSVDREQDGPRRVRRLAETGRCGLVACSAQLEPEGFDVVSSSPVTAVHRAYDRLRSRHERVHLLAPVLRSHEGGALAAPRGLAFLEAVREHGDGPAEELVRLTPKGARGTFESAVDWLRGPGRPDAVLCYAGYQAVALQIAAGCAGVRVPEELELLAIGDVPAEAELLGPISYYGVDDVFARISAVVVGRALEPAGAPGRLHRFDWEYFPGATTRDET